MKERKKWKEEGRVVTDGGFVLVGETLVNVLIHQRGLSDTCKKIEG
jgi:hypothetical protein